MAQSYNAVKTTRMNKWHTKRICCLKASLREKGDDSMEIGRVTPANKISRMQMTVAGSAKPESKTLQNKITTVQQQMQKISSMKELSVYEKTNERKKLQKELAALNTKLEQQEDALRRSQKRELLTEELQKNQEPAKDKKPESRTQAKEASSDHAVRKNQPADGRHTGRPGIVLLSGSDGVVRLKEGTDRHKDRSVNAEKKLTDEAREKDGVEKKSEPTDNDVAAANGLSTRDTHAMVSTDASIQQAGRLGTIITRTSDGIVILKGEIAQDERRGIDIEKKQAELKKLEKAEQRATAFQFSLLGEANKTMKSAADANNVTGIRDNTPAGAEKNAYINAMKASQEEQASQQKFYVSFSG